MKPAGVRVITTSSLATISGISASVESWKGRLGAKVTLMIEEDERELHEAEFNEAKKMFDDIFEYTLGCKRGTLFGKGPTLKEVLELCEASVEAETVLFLNADIRVVDNTRQLVEQLKECLKENELILLQRIDIGGTGNEIQRYREGYDGFALNPKKLGAYVDSYEFMRIGQVGWDYALPLGLDKGRVRIWQGDHFKHRVHPTGSSLQWEDAITRISFAINQTWISEAKASHQVALSCARSLLKWADLRSYHFAETKNVVKRGLSWLGCRVIYYGFIRSELRGVEALGYGSPGSVDGREANDI